MSGPAAESLPLPQLTYRGAAHGHGYERWREEFGRQLTAIDFEPLADGPIHCSVVPQSLPGMRLVRYAATPLRAISTGANDELVIILSHTSPVQVAMGHRGAEVPAGGATLGDTGIAGASSAHWRGGGCHSLLFDRELLLRRCPDAESGVAAALDRDTGVLTLLKTYCRIALEQTPGLNSLALSAVSAHFFDLATLLIGGHRDDLEQARDRGLAAVRLEAIKADVLASLADPALSVGAVARKHGISPRYVQRLFERTGASFSEFVLEQRLLLVARELISPANAARLISELAYGCGFSDLSYFNHRFRRRFGTTPSDMRAEAVGRFRLNK